MRKNPKMTTNINPAPDANPKPPAITQEPEAAIKEISSESGALAIVDASLILGLDNPLAKKAVIIPTKTNVMFQVTTEYDDTVLRSLNMTPKETLDGQVEMPGHEAHTQNVSAEVVPPEVAKPEVAPIMPVEGASPLSHDSSPERAIRKHMTPRSRRHMKGSQRFRRTDPGKKIMARLKRPSRHQPDVEEALNLMAKFAGKPVPLEDLRQLKNPALLSEALGVLLSMSMNEWDMTDEGVTNGTYEIVNENFTTNGYGKLLYNEQALKLDFDWIYNTRNALQKTLAESAINLGRMISE